MASQVRVTSARDLEHAADVCGFHVDERRPAEARANLSFLELDRWLVRAVHLAHAAAIHGALDVDGDGVAEGPLVAMARDVATIARSVGRPEPHDGRHGERVP